ncbi:translation initiation factor IF-2 [Thalassospiraceae bacterium LMO-SO8]|nr:translation initiation factor IF-2 [Alphaproteobacteria bacterium LMO-S08]WND77489.1 translation initiation factor IF-2 [Thalassospiraceae bacterium LMO-SO8]
MAETTEKDKADKGGSGKLGLGGGGGKLTLNKTVEKRQTRQNFSHGRSKMVTVEVKKSRTITPAKDDARPAGAGDAPRDDDGDTSTRDLTDQELQARQKALETAQQTKDEAPEAAPSRPLGPTPVVRAEPEPEPAEDAAAVADEPDAPAPAPAPADVAPAPIPGEDGRPARPRPAAARQEDDDDGPRGKSRGKKGPAEVRRAAPTRGYNERRRGKLTISDALEGEEERQRSIASVRRAREREKQKQRELLQEGAKVVREVVVPEAITVQELANRMAERGADVVKSLMKMGVMATITQTIDADTAELVVEEFGHRIRRVSESDVEQGLRRDQDDPKDLTSRAPVVTVMGHVDHGKTSLLDALRATDVAGGEAGGITQHIGAYQVTTPSGAKISFIDTPGHAAFTEMRARGAQVTDIVVLCVAADDGVMPQTIEAIHHAKAAGVPIIVAINKIDVPGADPSRVRTELLQHNVQVEEMGGDVLSIEVSALKKTNLDKLEEAIVLQAELLDLKANPNHAAEGVIVEARMEQGKGSVATVLIQRGTLRVGEIFIAGSEWGRVRAMSDAHGEQLDEAGPSVPVEILGLNGTPQAGDDFVVVDSESRAREVTEFRQRQERNKQAAAGGRGTLEQMFERIQEGEAQTVPLVIKADVHGSAEAIVGALEKLSTDEVRVQVLHSGVGGINESDVTLARASNAVIVGFNVRANPQARDLAKRDGLDIRYYSVIYNLTDDIKALLSGLLAPTIRENFLGYAEVREVFNVSKVGKVAGCMITEGTVKRGAKVRLLRDDTVIHEGDLSQLKRFKDDAKEVQSGTECGMALANYQDIQVGDVIECFETEEVAREL